MSVDSVCRERCGESTHVMDNLDIDLSSLFGWVGRRLVGEKGIAQAIDIATLGLVGYLLSGPLPLEWNLDIVVLAVGGKRSRCSGVESRIGAVTAGDGRASGR